MITMNSVLKCIPNYTTEEHIEKLASVGFNRISLGVQDFDPIVQFAINRVQSFERTKGSG